MLVTTYNGERFIEEQLASILAQTRPVQHVLICDDGSSDDTPALVRKFLARHHLEDWSFVVNERNLGPAANVLSHLVNLETEFVFLADQDDVWEPDKVELMTRYMRDNPDCTLAVSRTSLVDGTGLPMPSRSLRRGGGDLDLSRQARMQRVRELGFSDFLGYSIIPLHAMCVRSSVVRRIASGAQWPQLSRSLGADWYIGILASVLGGCAILPDRLVKRRVHDANISLGRLRKTTVLSATPAKRLLMLAEAKHAHEALLHDPAIAHLFTPQQLRLLKRMASFLAERIAFTSHPSARNGIHLLFRSGPLYLRSAGRPSGAIRMWIADLMYAYNINWALSRRKSYV